MIIHRKVVEADSTFKEGSLPFAKDRVAEAWMIVFLAVMRGPRRSCREVLPASLTFSKVSQKKGPADVAGPERQGQVLAASTEYIRPNMRSPSSSIMIE